MLKMATLFLWAMAWRKDMAFWVEETLKVILEEFGVFAPSVDIVYDEDEATSADVHANGNGSGRLKDLTTTQRQAIYETLLERSKPRKSPTKGPKLPRRTTQMVADRFGAGPRSIQREWNRAKQCRKMGEAVDVSSKKKKNSGRKKVTVDLSMVSSIPITQRGTIRSLAAALGISKSTVHRLFKDGKLRHHSNSLKPLLKEGNKKERLRWCLSMLDPDTLPQDPKFVEMDCILHADEKWFNATKKDRNVYLLQGEEDPHRTVQNKNAIDKCMFLSGVMLPRFDEEGNCISDGKIGIWPFVRKEPAQRRSRNRARGTLVTKTMKVDRNAYRSFLTTKMLPAIKAKWPPQDAHRTIWIKQDNAKTHLPVDDEQFAIAVAQTGLDIRLMNQPPNSPYMNCLDLGFFASLQSLTYKRVCRNMDELIANVEEEFQEYDPNTLRRVFLTLQGCLLEVMKADGGNRYKIPHMSKERLEALGLLPKVLRCDHELYEKVLQSLAA